MGFSSLSQKQIAEALGVTARTIRDWSAENFPRNEDGSYALPACIQWMIARETGTEGLNLEAERARLAKEQADRYAIENAVRRKEVLEVALVESTWTGLFTSVRARLLSLPTKVAAEVAAMGDANRVRDRIYDEVHQILFECSQYRPVVEHDDRDEAFDEMRADLETAAASDGKPMGGSLSTTEP